MLCRLHSPSPTIMRKTCTTTASKEDRLDSSGVDSLAESYYELNWRPGCPSCCCVARCCLYGKSSGGDAVIACKTNLSPSNESTICNLCEGTCNGKPGGACSNRVVPLTLEDSLAPDV